MILETLTATDVVTLTSNVVPLVFSTTGDALSSSNLVFFIVVWAMILTFSTIGNNIEIGFLLTYLTTVYATAQADAAFFNVVIWLIVVVTSGWASFIAYNKFFDTEHGDINT